MKNPPIKAMSATVFARQMTDRRGFSTTRIATFAVLSSMAFLVLNLLAAPASAQIKYDPEDPEVQEMINRGLVFIENNLSNNIGQRVMFGMAAYKAQVVTSPNPKDHPLIHKAVEFVQEYCTESALETNATFNKMYASALACVFLLELDGEKYKNEIEILLDHIHARQQDSGSWGYREYPTAGDTSQIQYIALALWLARQQGFDVDNQACKRALEWLIRTQKGDGGWWYQDPPGVVPTGSLEFGRTVRHSLVAAGLGSVYLLADSLKLTGGSGNGRIGPVKAEDLDLPPDVSDITDEENQDSEVDDRRALVSFDKGALNRSIGTGNNWFKRNFSAEVEEYNLYYLYGYERYAALREYVEGKNDIDDWYDQGVERLKEIQADDGSFNTGGEVSASVQTAFGILFLTRSMSITIDDNAEGILDGGSGFKTDAVLQEKGNKIVGTKVEANIGAMLEMMENPDEDEMKLYAQSLETMKLDESSRSQQLATLRGLVKHPEAQARLIAVKFLGRQRALDNVPAFIYSLSDPEPQIAIEAHKALKFVSRKTSVKNLSDEPSNGEINSVTKMWTEWYLKVQPDGVLLDNGSDEDDN